MTDKDNAMICTGAIPPQLIMGMELYQIYMKGLMNYCELYATLAGMDYWTRYFNQFRDTE